MRRLARYRLLSAIVVGSALAVTTGAQEQASPSSVLTPAVPATDASAAAATANPIVAAPGPGPAKPASALAPTVPRRSRAISPDVAAQLSAASPKFTPTPPKPRSEDEETDLRDVDKPKNGIIRLPKYVVREPAPAVLTERAVNTRQGLEELAMKRYVSEGFRALNRFYLPLFGSSMESYAMQRYAEEERLSTMSQLNDMAGMVSTTDRASGYYVKKQADQATMRPADFDWRPIGR